MLARRLFPSTRPVTPAWRRLGAPAGAALLMLLAAAGLALVLTPRWQSESVRPPPVRPAPLPPSAPTAPVAVRVSALLALAQQHGVTVQRTEQRAPQAAAVLFVMPVRAGYAALRTLVEAACLADPDLALESLRLRRNDANNTEVDAELVWRLPVALP
jgi:hypothetical protein